MCVFIHYIKNTEYCFETKENSHAGFFFPTTFTIPEIAQFGIDLATLVVGESYYNVT